MNREHISQAELVGRLGQKPELGETADGVQYVRLNIATSERYTDRGGEIREKTEWTALSPGVTSPSRSPAASTRETPSRSPAPCASTATRRTAPRTVSIELHVDSAEPNPDTQTSRERGAPRRGRPRDVESKTLDSGTAMTVLSIGTTTIANGKDREDWHSVTLWNKTAEAGAKEISAGDSISVNGVDSPPRASPGPRASSAAFRRSMAVSSRCSSEPRSAPRRRRRAPRRPERGGQGPSDASPFP